MVSSWPHSVPHSVRVMRIFYKNDANHQNFAPEPFSFRQSSFFGGLACFWLLLLLLLLLLLTAFILQSQASL